MTVTSQLYQLQEIDTQLDSNVQAVERLTRLIGSNAAIVEFETRLATERLHLEELTSQQHFVEKELADLASKQASVEKDLYGGKVRNPKELTDLQHESEVLKTKRSQVEEKELAILEQVELESATVNGLNGQLTKLKDEWQGQQTQFQLELEKSKASIASLTQKRQKFVSGIDPQAVAVYEEVKKKRATAVARVEQGLCRGCRISLSVAELQKVRTGKLIRCGSCGRILCMG
jgi:uncharacterized protein